MRKPAPRLEWEFAENEADWERRHVLSLSATSRRLPLRRSLWGVAALLLLLVSVSDWWWRSTEGKANQAVAFASATAQRELAGVVPGPNPLVVSCRSSQSCMDWWYQHEQEVNGLRAAVQATDPAGHQAVALQTVEVLGSYALAQVVSHSERGTPTYRQTRFYRRTPSGGWGPMAPEAALWGAEHSLATPYFIYHFRQHDAPVVRAVAAQIDTLYRNMRGNFGLALTPAPAKLVIDVSVTAPPDYASARFGTSNRFMMASPALYWAPLELTDAELLAQSMALPLLTYVLAQASDQDQIGAAWQPLVSGLHLWQVWDLDLPLSTWREEVVKWLYIDLPAVGPGQPIVLPAHYRELCVAHKLWLSSPAQLNIPLMCTGRDWDDWYLGLWGSSNPLTRLAQLSVPVPKALTKLSFSENQRGQTVALATLIEYAVATYGRARLPVLVADLGHYPSWETLIPAVYGVSAADFEAGWQAYLAAHYGVSVAPKSDSK